ncbi:unnamed protein product [Somion occarium]|uniref:Uncharacterized protein n=1 Tax=Somion occarium TaxID=3059160 RepID=A0ABP1DD23_9APHY
MQRDTIPSRPVYHNGVPLPNASCGVELYGYCVSDVWMQQYAEANNIKWKRYHAPQKGMLDTEARDLAVINHIRNAVVQQLDRPLDDWQDVLSTHFVTEIPDYVKVLDSYGPKKTDVHRLSWTIIYIGSNENEECIDRALEAEHMIKALQSVLKCGHQAPEWIPEGELLRNQDNIPEWSPRSM